MIRISFQKNAGSHGWIHQVYQVRCSAPAALRVGLQTWGPTVQGAQPVSSPAGHRNAMNVLYGIVLLSCLVLYCLALVFSQMCGYIYRINSGFENCQLKFDDIVVPSPKSKQMCFPVKAFFPLYATPVGPWDTPNKWVCMKTLQMGKLHCKGIAVNNFMHGTLYHDEFK